YYVGVNIGGFLAPLICGTLGELYGWHWGFGAAGLVGTLWSRTSHGLFFLLLAGLAASAALLLRQLDGRAQKVLRQAEIG
uniref:POT-type proton-dependent oligopeptide transporter n=1 Tax=Sphingomonas sp. TaxID=28214 RepID=UPI003B3A3FB0